MPNDFISKMAHCVAFLYHERDLWREETKWEETANLFELKIETCRDICAMFGVRTEVWREAKKIYDWEESENEED